MADKIWWTYERLDEDYKIKYAPINDFDGKATGHIVFGVKQWLDENPNEARRLGWIKHIHHSTEDIDYNRRSQYLIKTVQQIDEYTVEDVYYVMNKSEEQMRIEETLNYNNDDGGIWFSGGDWDV